MSAKRKTARGAKGQRGSGLRLQPFEPLTVFTVGHSTRKMEEFTRLLGARGIECVADIRTLPRSRHNPQFNREMLRAALRACGIGYAHLSMLGGLRHAKPDSSNTAWRNASFRGFADYMRTPEFERGLDRLVRLTRRRRVAIMCAEAVPWRCHRTLVADALLAKGFRVEHILSATEARAHAMTPWARVERQQVTYPAAADDHSDGLRRGRRRPATGIQRPGAPGRPNRHDAQTGDG